jgi:nucleoside 2-deoxyribosyltransferase
MKIYFAGPLFTPYVRDFISKHADILREHGIEPFVPHESALKYITPEKIEGLIQKGLITREELGDGPEAKAAIRLMGAGRITREDLGIPPYSAKQVFDVDYEGLAPADAVLAILDGTQVDDGTACEIGIFYGLMLQDPSKKGIVGLMTDSRGARKSDKGFGVNLFVLGVLEECGPIYTNFDDALNQLKTWASEM